PGPDALPVGGRVRRRQGGRGLAARGIGDLGASGGSLKAVTRWAQFPGGARAHTPSVPPPRPLPPSGEGRLPPYPLKGEPGFGAAFTWAIAGKTVSVCQVSR